MYKDISLSLKLVEDLGVFMPLAGPVSQMDVSQWFPDKSLSVIVIIPM